MCIPAAPWPVISQFPVFPQSELIAPARIAEIRSHLRAKMDLVRRVHIAPDDINRYGLIVPLSVC